jgi:hypothetical protein
VTVDDDNQNHSAAVLNCFARTQDLSFVDGAQTGYEGITHRRQVLFARPVAGVPPYLVVIDRITGTGVHAVDQYFHFLPAPVKQGTLEMHTVLPDGPNLLVRAVFAEGVAMEAVDSEVSFVYTEKEPRSAVRYRQKRELPVSFVTLLVPYPGAVVPKIVASEMALEGAIGVRVEGDGFLDVIFATDEPVVVSELDIKKGVRAGLIRTHNGKTETQVIE